MTLRIMRFSLVEESRSMIEDTRRQDMISQEIAKMWKGLLHGKDVAYHQKVHCVRPLIAFFVPSSLAGAFLALPLLVLLWYGVDAGFTGYMQDPSVIHAARLSLSTSVLSLLVTLALGTPLAYLLARWSFPHKVTVETIVDLPIVLPPMVAGIGLLLAFGRNGVLGGPLEAMGIHLPFTTAAVIFAQAFVSAPLYIRAARQGFAAINPEVIEAAYTDGATEFTIFRRVMAPLAGRAMLNGLILAWARAFGEFGATMIFAGNLQGVTQTMPLVIFNGFETNLGVALSLSLLLIMISALILLSLRMIEKNASVNI
jgi:molybdate transport system permease protein